MAKYIILPELSSDHKAMLQSFFLLQFVNISAKIFKQPIEMSLYASKIT